MLAMMPHRPLAFGTILALKLNPVDVGIRLLNELEFEDEYTRIY
jgi:hypothetical protein